MYIHYTHTCNVYTYIIHVKEAYYVYTRCCGRGLRGYNSRDVYEYPHTIRCTLTRYGTLLLGCYGNIIMYICMFT